MYGANNLQQAMQQELKQVMVRRNMSQSQPQPQPVPKNILIRDSFSTNHRSGSLNGHGNSVTTNKKVGTNVEQIQRSHSGETEVGVIILGNSGVGKSFLGNVIIGKEVFQHDYRVDAVTLKTEYLEASLDGHLYSIYNIPGLIEADQERIDSNIREIDIAFRQHPNAVVLFVFGTNNGKIRNEDVVAFNSINAAYPLSQKSLIIVMNGVSPHRPASYDGDVKAKIEGLLKISRPTLCFVNQIKQETERLPIRKQLVPLILAAMPKVHRKVQDINVKAAEIAKLTKIVDQLQKQLDDEREKRKQEDTKHQSTIAEMKNQINRMTTNQERLEHEAKQLQKELQEQQRSQIEANRLQQAQHQKQLHYERERRRQDEKRHETAITEMKNRIGQMLVNQERSEREANKLQQELQQELKCLQREVKSERQVIEIYENKLKDERESRKREEEQRQWAMHQKDNNIVRMINDQARSHREASELNEKLRQELQRSQHEASQLQQTLQQELQRSQHVASQLQQERQRSQRESRQLQEEMQEQQWRMQQEQQDHQRQIREEQQRDRQLFAAALWLSLR